MYISLTLSGCKKGRDKFQAIKKSILQNMAVHFLEVFGNNISRQKTIASKLVVWSEKNTFLKSTFYNLKKVRFSYPKKNLIVSKK